MENLERISGIVSIDEFTEQAGFLLGPCPKNGGFGKTGLSIKISDGSFCCFACRVTGSIEDLVWHVLRAEQ